MLLHVSFGFPCFHSGRRLYGVEKGLDGGFVLVYVLAELFHRHLLFLKFLGCLFCLLRSMCQCRFIFHHVRSYHIDMCKHFTFRGGDRFNDLFFQFRECFLDLMLSFVFEVLSPCVGRCFSDDFFLPVPLLD